MSRNKGIPSNPMSALSDDSPTEEERRYARVFGTAEGKRILTALRRVHVDCVGGPDMSDSALRFLEGKRALVLEIERKAKRGDAI